MPNVSTLDPDQGTVLGFGERHEMARPKKETHEKRTAQRNLRFTLAEDAQLQAAARAAGLSVSEYVRRRALGHPVSFARRSTDPALAAALSRVGNNVNQLARAAHRGQAFQQHWRTVGDELRTVLAKALADIEG